MYGMPNGPPSQSAPKSGCRWSAVPMEAIRVREAGSTPAVSIRVFQALPEGNGRRPLRLALGPSAGTAVAAVSRTPGSEPVPAEPGDAAAGGAGAAGVGVTKA